MTFIDLFAGIGGFRRGMELAGHKCVGFCEYDRFAVGSYTAMHLMTDEERDYIKSLQFNKRLKEVLKEEYRHGEWYADDIRRLRADDIPRVDVWCFGFPCQDISIAGKQKGLAGNRSGLFHTVIRLLEDTEEEYRPSVLFIENVKNLLSVNRGFDFLTVLTELDKVGYDVEWQVINSADYVPQNRERIFIIGHLRVGSGRKVFPVEGTDRKNSILQIGNCMPTKTRDNPNNGRIYSVAGIAPCLNKMDGGNRQPFIALCDMSYGAGLELYNQAFCLTARYNKGVTSRKKEVSGVAVLTGSDYINFVWCEKENCHVSIRKLTPRECFRLQGWEDRYFDRAALVNSDSQLYKQAGNGVTVPVIYEIARRL